MVSQKWEWSAKFKVARTAKWCAALGHLAGVNTQFMVGLTMSHEGLANFYIFENEKPGGTTTGSKGPLIGPISIKSVLMDSIPIYKPHFFSVLTDLLNHILVKMEKEYTNVTPKLQLVSRSMRAGTKRP